MTWWEPHLHRYNHGTHLNFLAFNIAIHIIVTEGMEAKAMTKIGLQQKKKNMKGYIS